MRFFSRLVVGLSLAALPAFCAPLALNGANDWYGFYWNNTYTPTSPGVFPGAYSSIPSGTGTAYGQEGMGGIVGTYGPTTIKAASPSGGPDSATFTVGGAGGTTLKVTDLATPGDYFAIYDNGVLLGSTNSVPQQATYYCGYNTSPNMGSDPAACFVDPNMSHGTFAVTAGDVITIVVASNNFNGSGTAAFQLGGTGGGGGGGVPEPTTLSLMGIGLGGMLLGWRKQRG